MTTRHTTTTGGSIPESDTGCISTIPIPGRKLDSAPGNPDDEPWIGTAAAAKHVGASIPTFRRWLKQNLVSSKRTPTGELRFRRSQLNNLIR